MIRRLLTFIFLIGPAFTGLLLAAPSPIPVINSDQMAVDDRNQELIFSGNARITDGEVLFTADEVRYQKETDTAVATGRVIVTRGSERLLADKVIYHRKTQLIEAFNVRMGHYPLYLSAKSASGSRAEMTLRQTSVSLLEPGAFQPTIDAGSLTYFSDQKILAADTDVGIGNFQPFHFRSFEQKLNEPAISYLALTGGYRGSLGAYLEAGLRMPIYPGIKLGADLSYYTKRGFMFGPSGRYGFNDARHDIYGYIRSGFINDHGTKLNDVLGRPVTENRGYFEWQHMQTIDERISIVGQLNYWKDSEILRDFRPRDFFEVQQPDTFFESAYTGQNYVVSAFVRAQPNSFQIIKERLPEFRFDLLPTALAGGIYQKFNASAASLRYDPIDGSPVIKSDRLDAYYGLERPYSPVSWFTLNPVAGGRATYYNDASGSRNTYTRTLGEVGFDAQLRSNAVYNYKNEIWEIDGLRHLLTPKISYRYVPDANRGRSFIPQIDTRTFLTYLPPLGLGDTRNIDDLREQNVVRFQLDNSIQTRDPVYGSRDLLVFNVANDLRFSREPGERDVSQIHTEFAFMPARWVEFGLYQSFTPQTWTLNQLNSGITFRDADKWTLMLGNRYYQHEVDTYIADYTQRLNEVYQLHIHLNYDSRESRFNEQSFGLRQNINNTWVIGYNINLYGGPRRESDFGFSLQVELLAF